MVRAMWRRCFCFSLDHAVHYAQNSRYYTTHTILGDGHTLFWEMGTHFSGRWGMWSSYYCSVRSFVLGTGNGFRVLVLGPHHMGNARIQVASHERVTHAAAGGGRDMRDNQVHLVDGGDGA